MRPIFYVVVVLSLFTAGGLYSQQAFPIPHGERIRVTAPQCGVQRLVTTFEAYGSGALMLPSRSCPLEAVTRLEVRSRQQRQTLSGLRNGLLGGIGIGIVGGLVYCTVEQCGEYAGCFATVTTVFGAGAGLVVGGIVGSLIKTDRWEDVPLDWVQVSFGPQDNRGVGFGLTVFF
jgi:hypothetical protein